ncbi:MAG: replicative DNA helicase, partial [Planctomycetota bacterium]
MIAHGNGPDPSEFDAGDFGGFDPAHQDSGFAGAMERGSRRGSRRGKKGGDGDSMSEILRSSPPFDADAELGVLGSVLLLPRVMDDIVTIIKAEDFYVDANRLLFQHMLDMHDAGEKIDPTLLVARLRKSDELDRVGGVAYLGQIGTAVPNAVHVVYYAKIVAEKGTYRRLIDSCTEILGDAYQQNSEARELVAQAEQKIFNIMEGRSNQKVNSITDILADAMDRMEARAAGEHVDGGVDTHLTDFDAQTGGLHAGELIILAARPSMGKTALALNISEAVAMKENQPVLFVSLEMSGIELADRLLCSLARVNGHSLRNGTLKTEEKMRLNTSANSIGQAPLFVDDSPQRTVSEIAAGGRRIRRAGKGLGLIVIDYLQLIEPDNSRDPRQEQVAKIARRLKGMARE